MPRKPCTPSAARHTLDMVLLATFLLSDDTGLICAAGLAAIARQAGVQPETAERHLRRLDRAGVVAWRPQGPGRRALVVLMDHPVAPAMLEAIARRDRGRARARARRAAGLGGGRWGPG